MQRERGPPWGRNKGKGEVFRPVGKPGRRFLQSQRKRGGTQGLRSDGITGGDCQEVGGGVELPRGTGNPGVEEFSRGNKTSRVTIEGDGVLGTDGQGKGEDGKFSANRDTEGEHHNLLRRGDGERGGYGGAAKRTAENGRGREGRDQTGEHAKKF